jgi:hypothetical protein
LPTTVKGGLGVQPLRQHLSQQGTKLTGSGATGNSEFGESVALSGDGNTALIGGHRDNTFKGPPGCSAAPDRPGTSRAPS